MQVGNQKPGEKNLARFSFSFPSKPSIQHKGTCEDYLELFQNSALNVEERVKVIKLINVYKLINLLNL